MEEDDDGEEEEAEEEQEDMTEKDTKRLEITLLEKQLKEE